MCRKGGNSISRAQSSGADAFLDRPAMQNRTNLRVGQKHHLGLAGVRTTELEGAPTRSVERVMGRPGPTGRILRRDHQVGGGAIRQRRQGLYANGGRVASVAVAEDDGNVPYCGWGEAGAGGIGALSEHACSKIAIGSPSSLASPLCFSVTNTTSEPSGDE